MGKEKLILFCQRTILGFSFVYGSQFNYIEYFLNCFNSSTGVFRKGRSGRDRKATYPKKHIYPRMAMADTTNMKETSV